MLPLFYRGSPQEEAQQKASIMLAKVGLETMTEKYPNQLSGGQQQRVAIARALVGDPAIILADEPTGALDSQTSTDIMQLLSQLNETESRTILIITHDLSISRQCRRVIEIQDGCIF
jgi:putative ABC transport system ATP-binding protein